VLANGLAPWNYWMGSDRAWNCFDFTVVVFSVQQVRSAQATPVCNPCPPGAHAGRPAKSVALTKHTIPFSEDTARALFHLTPSRRKGAPCWTTHGARRCRRLGTLPSHRQPCSPPLPLQVSSAVLGSGGSTIRLLRLVRLARLWKLVAKVRDTAEQCATAAQR